MKKIIPLLSCIIVVVAFLLITNNNKSQLYTSNIDSIDGLAFYTQTEEGSGVRIDI